jgi:outer membrane protein TolC
MAEVVPLAVALEDAQARRAGLRDDLSRMPFNPVLQLQPGYRDLKTGGSGAEVYVSVMQRLSVSGLGKKRARSLDAELSHDEALRALARRVTRRHVASAWLAQWSAQTLQALAESEREGAARLVKDFERALSAGEATRVDLEQARAFVATAELNVLNAEGRVFETGIALTRSLGLTADGPRVVAAELPRIDVDGLQRNLAEHAARSPGALEAASRERVEAHKLEEITAAHRPGMAVGATAWREGGGDVAALLTWEIEIGAFDHGERERADQVAQVALAKGQRTQAVVDAHAARVLALHEVRHTEAVLRATEQGSVTAAQALVDVQRARLEAGEGSADEWVRARRALLEAQAAAIEARAAHALARFTLSELVSASDGSPR